MKTLMIVAAAVAALAAPALASAKPAISNANDLNQVLVSFADLNLNTPSGQASFKARIHRAAMDACGAQPDSKDLRAARQFDACVQQSIGAATAAVPAASLVAGVNGHNG
jgi:UrcA family protein